MVTTIKEYFKTRGLHDCKRGCRVAKRQTTKEKISRACRKPNVWKNYIYNESMVDDKPSMAGEDK